MNLSKLIITLFSAFLLLNPVSADTAREERDYTAMRARAAKLVKEQQERESRENYYKNLNKKEAIPAYREAADIYEKLLRETDDRDSGNDAVSFINTARKAYSYLLPKQAGRPEGYPSNVLKEVYKKHAGNSRYLWKLWSAFRNEADPGFWWYNDEAAEKYKEAGYSQKNELHYLLKLKRGEDILNMLPGNMNPEEQSQFLLAFAATFYADGNNGRSSGYGLLHILTDLAAEPVIQANSGIFPENGIKEKLTTPDGAPIVYRAPKSWKEAANNGERVFYLFSEAVKAYPDRDALMREARARLIMDSFSPFQVVNSSYFVSGTDDEDTAVQEFYTLLPTISAKQTILLKDKKPVVTDLPEELQYFDELEALAYGRRSGEKSTDTSYSKNQVRMNNIRNTASALFIRELLTRLKYPEAADHCRTFLKDIPDPSNTVKRDMRFTLTRIMEHLTHNKGCFPSLSPEMDDGIRHFSDHASIKVPLLYRNARKAELSLYRINTEYLKSLAKKNAPKAKSIQQALEKTYPSSSNILLRKCLELHINPSLGKDLLEKPIEAVYTLHPEKNNQDTLDYLQLPELKAGIYLISARFEGEETPAYKFIKVSGLNVNALPSRDGVLISVTDARTGEPKKQADIAVTQLGTSSGKTKSGNTINKDTVQLKEFQLKTDDRGLCTIQLEKGSPGTENTYAFILAATLGEDSLFSVISSITPQVRSYGETTTSYIVTDRPVYRPGQTVHWSAWLGRTSIFSGAEPLGGKDVTVSFGDLSDPIELKSDERGMISGSILVPMNAKLQGYQISVVMKTPEGDDPLGYGAQISVEEYKKPDMLVTVDTGKTVYPYGARVKATVKANYYSGEPVREGEVRIRVDQDNRYSYGRKQEALIPEKLLALDKNGEAILEFSLPEYKEGTPDNDWHSEQFKITAVTTDASQRQIESTAHIGMRAVPYSLNTSLSLPYAVTGENVTGDLDFTTMDKEPVAAEGQAVLSSVSGRNNKEVLTKQKSWTVTTSDKGKAPIDFNVAMGGKYCLEFIFPNASFPSKPVKSKTYFYVAGKTGEDSHALPEDQSFHIIPRKNSGKAGEKIRFLVITPPSIKSVLLAKSMMYADEEVMILDTPGQLTEGEWLIEEKNAPNFEINAFIANRDDSQYTITSIAVEQDKKNLLLKPEITAKDDHSPSPVPEEKHKEGNTETSTPSLPAFEPGQEAIVKVRVRLPDGSNAVNTPVLITVYDKSLEEFIKYHGGRFLNDLDYSPFWQLFRSSFYNRPVRQDYSLPVQYERDNFIDHPGYGYYRYFSRKDDLMKRFMGKYGAYACTTDENGILTADKTAALTLDPGREMATKRSYLHINKENRLWKGLSKGTRWGGSILSGALEGDFVGAIEASPSVPASVGSASVAYEAAYDSGRKDKMEIAGKPLNGLERMAGNTPDPVVRSEFADLLKWSGTLITDSEGMVSLPVKMPDNLTSWRSRAWAVDKELRAGSASVEFVTTQSFIAQLHTPRFLVEKDLSEFTAVLRNNSDHDETVTATLTVKGDALKLTGSEEELVKTVKVPARDSASVSWTATAQKEGEVTLTLVAKGPSLGDASSQVLPLVVRGAYRGDSLTASINPGEKSVTGELSLPEKINPALTRVNINVSPGLAPVVLRALPYLSNYPYGCIEQSLNQFIPSVIVRKTFRDLNLNVAELAASFHGPENRNPLADEKTLNDQVNEGLAKIVATQNQDGGWSWFPGGQSSAYITAQVAHGLQFLDEKTLNRSSGYHSPAEVLKRALDYLKKTEEDRVTYITKSKNRMTGSSDVYIHAVLRESDDTKYHNKTMTGLLIRDRHHLSAYPLARLGLILHRAGYPSVRDDILQALSKTVSENREDQTAWLDLPADRCWWNWDEDHIEAQAAYLQLLTATAPKAPRTRAVAKWLADNRANSFYWKSTRDTALVIEALCGYIKESGEGTKPVTLELSANGKVLSTIIYDPANLGAFKGEIELNSSGFTPGKHALELRRVSGDTETPVYLAAGVRFFSIEDKLLASGKDLTIKRTINRVVSGKTSAGYLEFKKVELKEGDSLSSGDIIEVVLEVDAKNDYQYLMIRDPKPAGCEPYNLTSGYQSSNGNPQHEYKFYLRNSYYTELADRETRIFVERLPKEKSIITYKLRVERPGTYTALPTQIEAMYAPLLRGNSDENILTIKNKRN